MVKEDLHELLSGFVSESIDNLDDNELRIGRLGNEDNAEDLKALFRVFHTLKGLSGFFELNVINKVTHTAENLLDILRENPRQLSDDEIDFLYKVFDFLRNAIISAGNDRSDEAFAEEGKEFIARISEKINEHGTPAPAPKQIDLPVKKDSEISIYNIFSVMGAALAEMETKPELIGSLIEAVETLKKRPEITSNKTRIDIVESLSMIAESGQSGDIPIDSGLLSILESDLASLRVSIDEDPAFSATRQAEQENIPVAPVAVIAETPDTPETVPLQSSAPPKTIYNENYKAQHGKKDEKPAIKHVDIAQKSPAGVASHPAKEMPSPAVPAVIAPERKEVRVSVSKLTGLFDLVGEIITIENMVINNRDLESLDLPNFTIAANMLNKLIRQLQQISMSIMMIPLDGLFNKMTRLVRDTARKESKIVRLDIFGSETEMDKNVIEELSDPLVHIIRNSIDHGIEMPQDRVAAGKPEEGRLVLGASYQGNEILIVIEDDGAGLNREKILAKAVDRGLVSGNPEEIPDEEVWKLIFEPGLSTAAKVTDISGRGVGMDVVKKNIEKLRGNIEIVSKKGEGTKITFKIPLTLAILDAMIVRVGKARYAIPILSIRESFRPAPEDITVTPDGAEVVRVRKDLYPVIRLYEVMGIKPDTTELDKGTLIMLISRGKRVCLLIDEIIGQQQTVVKPLSEYMGEVRGITGCMVMSDGKVGLIIDTDSMIKKAESLTK